MGVVRLLVLTSVVHAKWSQDRFAISMWVDPIVPTAEFDARYAELAAANFTVLLGGFGAKGPDAVAASLAACERHGLKAIVDTCNGNSVPPGTCVESKTIASSTALWGFLMKDEPSVPQFPGLANWSTSIAKAAPDALRFMNLLPNYASHDMLQAASYGEYVDAFVHQVAPDVLCTDHYPHFMISSETANDTLDGYHRNLGVLRGRSLAASVPFWNFFNAMPFSNHVEPTEGQLAWQAFTSLAYGAKGVLYFCYWSPTLRADQEHAMHRSLLAMRQAAATAGAADAPGVFAKGGGLLTPVRYGVAPGADDHLSWERSAQYERASRVNGVLRIFGGVLLHAVSVGVWRLPEGPAAGCSIASLVETDAHGAPGQSELSQGRYLVGQFKLPDGRSAVLLQNQRHDVGLWPTVTLANSSQAPGLLEVDPLFGGERHVRDDSPMLPGLQLALAPGMARLLVLP